MHFKESGSTPVVTDDLQACVENKKKIPNMSPSVLAAYGLKVDNVTIEPFGSGLINRTWKVVAQKDYILQKINQHVFREPANIACNLRLIADYLKAHHPDYLFVEPIRSVAGEDLVYCESDGYYRLFPFVHDSHTIDVVETPEQAYEAARQFGRFTRMLAGMDAGQLKITIPSFHDLDLRYRQFLAALKEGSKDRIAASGQLIERALSHADIVTQYKAIQTNPAFKLRVTHHDTKISNVLFDAQDKGLCVIDLDTVMPGYFISDVGDMLRTYLSPVSEEETDVTKISVRDAFYKAVVEGYHAEMKDELTEGEKQHFFYAGQFMIYMQALRFLTDHLLGDVYYGARYEGHNFYRAQNQMVLLERLTQKPELKAIQLS